MNTTQNSAPAQHGWIVLRRKDGTVTARIPGVWCASAGCYVSIPEKE